MKNKSIIYLLLVLLFGSCQEMKKDRSNNDVLWYDKPAGRWEEALPIGNGRLGAMIFSDPLVEQIQLNEETVWAGEPGNNINVDFSTILPEVRKLIFQEKFIEAQEYANKYFPRRTGDSNNYGMCYQPVGDLFIEFPELNDVENYKRSLDISKALQTTTFKSGDVTYKRETFASLTDDVIIIKLTADKPGSISCNLSVNTPQLRYNVKTVDNRLELRGISGNYENKSGKVKFTTLIKPLNEGGEVSTTDSTITVKNASSLILYLSTGTNFISYKDISGDADKKAEDLLQKALTKEYNEARLAHVKKYANYYDRVKLDLGVTDSVNNPTNVRLAQFNDGNDPQLVSLYFQYGRYLLISSSQPGTQPANLQGIWNNRIKPHWDSKYTVNINTEMNYWPSEVTNLSELSDPLFSLIKDISVTGQESASKLYGARGWNIHHNTDIWRISGPVDGAYYGLWPMGGAWLSQHMWQHYMYSGDTEFLKEVYPIFKGLAEFYVDVMHPDPKTGWYVVVPSMSPENSHHSKTTIASGTTMDNQLVFDVFTNFLKSSELLGADKVFADSVSDILKKMPPMQIGNWGQLQEWLIDWDKQGDKHRHVSHLYGLYPSNQISPYQTPELWAAAEKSLVARGDKSTGWSMGWKVNLWARLLDGDHAYKLIEDQLTPSIQPDSSETGGTYPNLFDAHPPFQIDGNFGCTSGIAEMLMQSHDGAIHILPALPSKWKNGEITGLKARGGFELDIKWSEGEISEVKILSKLGGNCRIRSYFPLQGDNLIEADGENTNPFYQTAQIKKHLVNAKEEIEVKPLREIYEYEFISEKSETTVLIKK